jgi:hypothetical protein
MKTIVLIALLALAGCAAPTTEPVEEEKTDQQSEALQVGGGGTLPDRDTCEATRAGCYTSCKGKGSSCYRYCDIIYAQCRGLPPPTLGYAM